MGEGRALAAEQAEAEALALDLMYAKHSDNPDAPASMVRAGCALPLAEALWDLGWRHQTTTSAPGVAAPAESAPAPCITASGASAPTSAEVVPTAEQAARFTVAEVAEVDAAMNDHMQRHNVSNSPLRWTCDTDCRRRALADAINDVLVLRSATPPGSRT